MQQDEFKALELARRHFDDLLSRLPQEARKKAIGQIKQRSYNSSLTHVLNTVYEGWDSTSTRLMGRTMETLHSQIRGVREMQAARPEYRPMDKHLSTSSDMIRSAIRAARPSARNIDVVEGTGTSIMTTGTGSFTVRLSPGYWKFARRFGVTHYKGLIFLDGFKTLTPYDGAEVWNCRAYDTANRETRVVYVGRIYNHFIVHANASYCTTSLQKRAAKASLAAMKASMVG